MTQLMGILNITPDSFSGDGLPSTSEALERIDAMIASGADIIDIGAESTRPGARVLDADEEWQRLEPVMAGLAHRRHQVRFSIDTRHPSVARRALGAGCSWLNDVGGGADGAMTALARESGATFVVMHALGVPADPKITLPESCDPVDEILAWSAKRLEELERAGLKRSQIVLDPGIGFGKTRAQSLALIRNAARLKALGVPVLIGHSRKSFLSLFTDAPASGRDSATLLVSAHLARLGADYLRVHDITGHRVMLRIHEALT